MLQDSKEKKNLHAIYCSVPQWLGRKNSADAGLKTTRFGDRKKCQQSRIISYSFLKPPWEFEFGEIFPRKTCRFKLLGWNGRQAGAMSEALSNQ